MVEDVRIPILNKWHPHPQEEEEDGIRCVTMKQLIAFLVIIFIPCFVLIRAYSQFSYIDEDHPVTFHKPEIRVESLYVCPIAIPNQVDVWALRFNITNLNNITVLCLQHNEASIFNPNGSDSLLAKGLGVYQQTCVQPLTHTIMNMTFTSEGETNRSDWGEFFDIKLRSRFFYNFHDELCTLYRIAEIVCSDAKLAFPKSSSNSSSSSLSCGTMIGDPPQCSFVFYQQPRFID